MVHKRDLQGGCFPSLLTLVKLEFSVQLSPSVTNILCPHMRAANISLK